MRLFTTTAGMELSFELEKAVPLSRGVRLFQKSIICRAWLPKVVAFRSALVRGVVGVLEAVKFRSLQVVSLQISIPYSRLLQQARST